MLTEIDADQGMIVIAPYRPRDHGASLTGGAFGLPKMGRAPPWAASRSSLSGSPRTAPTMATAMAAPITSREGQLSLITLARSRARTRDPRAGHTSASCDIMRTMAT